MPDLPSSDTNPLIAIDTLLDQIAKLRGASEASAVAGLLKSFCEAILRSEQVNQSFWASDPVYGIFHQELTQRNKRFIGVCLIRLLSSSDLLFQLDAFHANAYRLFDAAFGEDVYRQLGLTTKQQTFEKEARLLTGSPIESELSEVLESLTSLEVLPAFRQSFMRVLNGPLSKAILWPFLPVLFTRCAAE